MTRPDSSSDAPGEAPAAASPGARAIGGPARAPEVDELASGQTLAPGTAAGSQPGPVGTTTAPTRPGTAPWASAGRPVEPRRAGDQVFDQAIDHAAERAGDLGTLPIGDPAHYIPDREVARGGMGRIVAARDRRLRRTVALKELIAADPDQALRFRREALITARLQHPAIVPVYEAGCWPSGEPFYAMKLVAGRPLDRVVADAGSLDARMALLPSVIAAADAIAYAHSQRVIHRDLKPANVLIGDFGETVVIDWGLAKDLDTDDVAAPLRSARAPAAASAGGASSSSSAARTRPITGRAATPVVPIDATIAAPGGIALGSDATVAVTPTPAAPVADAVDDSRPAADLATVAPAAAAPDAAGAAPSTLTIAGSIMGTPAYMPPEQARGDVVDERADVFALGAMLYHVLAGAPPYQARTATDVIADAIAGKVVPLRQRAARAPADLIAIVERAMAHEPADRYPSARELADELRRFQTGQLVGAHHYTLAERLRRFVRRHRGAVTIAAIALAGFAIGGTIAVRRVVVERDRAEDARAIADRRRVAAEGLVDYMMSDMRTRLERIGRLELLAGIGTEVRAYYDGISGTPGGMEPADVERMAAALQLLGDADQARGELDRAMAVWRDARVRIDALLAAFPADPQTPARRRRVARLAISMGTALQARGRVDDARASYRDGLAVLDGLRDGNDDPGLLLDMADAHDRLGDLDRNGGHVDGAMAEYRRSLDLRTRADELDGGPTLDGAADDVAKAAIATSHLKLASGHQAGGMSAAALAEYRACEQLRADLASRDPEDSQRRQALAYVRGLRADLQRETGALDDAIATYTEALVDLDALVRKDPMNTGWRRDRGNMLSNLGFALVDRGDLAPALARHRAAIASHTELVAVDPDNTGWQIDLSRMHTRLGDAELHGGDVTGALASYETARTMRRALVDRDSMNTAWRRSLAWSHHKVANGLAAAGDLAGAQGAAREARDLRHELALGAPDHAGLANELAMSEVLLGRLLVTRGDAGPGLTALDAGIAAATELVDRDPLNLEWKEAQVEGLTVRGAARLDGGDVTGGCADLDAAVATAVATAVQAPASALWQVAAAEARWVRARCLRARAAGDAAVLASARREAAEATRILEELAAAGQLTATKRGLLEAMRKP